MVLTVHYGVSYRNAFWDIGLEQMAFGDGAAQTDDVVAHEITHGVTQHTANLFYLKQSGALNESFSDIFGETIDLTNGAGNDTPSVRWLASEDWTGVGPFRNMMDPRAMGSPGKISDPELACGDEDNGGVHTNSGILNHAYALAVDGGTYNGRTIVGVGFEKAGRVMYRALTTYLTRTSDFQDADSSIRQSCADLVGSAGLTAADCVEVGRALDAVELALELPCLGSIVVTKSGDGDGTVTSNPQGIDCGATCEATFTVHETVVLTPTPVPGAVFTGWGGSCSGIAPCSVNVQGLARHAVSAGFSYTGAVYPLVVSVSGMGTVTSSPPGIECGGACEAAFLTSSPVTLTATAPPGWGLEAWGGDCSGRGSCQLTIDGPKNVTATFSEGAFTEATTLAAVSYARAAWGDYDGDGDLDLVVSGFDGVRMLTRIYRNDGGSLVDAQVPLIQVTGVAAWGDYDNDGDLDLVVAGSTIDDIDEAQLYRNDSGTFTPVATPFVGCGVASYGRVGRPRQRRRPRSRDRRTGLMGQMSLVYRNDHGTFVDSGSALTAVARWRPARGATTTTMATSTSWSPRRISTLAARLSVYRNDRGVLTDSHVSLPGTAIGSVGWADYDADGDLDLALAGNYSGRRPLTKVFRNDAGVLTDSGIEPHLSPERLGDLGRLRLGRPSRPVGARLGRQRFLADDEAVPATMALLSARYSAASRTSAWAGRLGETTTTTAGSTSRCWARDTSDVERYFGVFHNDAAASNTPPQPPSDLTAAIVSDGVLLQWSRGSDSETPNAALSYNVRVGTTPGGSEVMSAMADVSTG